MSIVVPRKSSNLLKRRLKIAEIVSVQGEIKVDELSAQLGVSGVTIRGDLSYLEQQGYLKRSFGGAIATPALQTDYEPAPLVVMPPLAQQMELARHSMRLIRDRDTLFLGHGALCRRLIPLLNGLKKIRLITNDPESALLANQYIEGDIILAGSEMLRPDGILAGKSLEQALQHHTITHSIMEVNSIDADGTLGIDVPELALAWQLCFDNARSKTILMAATSGAATATIGHLNQTENVIVCHSINEQYQQQLYDADFVTLYTNNECFTWSNRERLQE
ncbi:DeoR/GlpR family DNA-binding transcription regulator [Trabulsiella odontotermitis]|uniref:DeoR/GlpR family DNA-binding transcription regulator n=1 Tax=Trabulsiella odontotermitis TaxID=379893 RepID=UPI0006768A63|nr:DeoR/GlpR family DNA-binding transcription regulator [Trabulsiella odontotermitis]